MNWYVDVLKKYAVFSGRARRKEYWMFFLINFVIAIALSIVDTVAGTSPVIYGLYVLATFLPNLGVTVRRLHDTDRSGWWVLIGVIPLVGFIILLVFLASDGKPGENKWGLNPKFAPAV